MKQQSTWHAMAVLDTTIMNQLVGLGRYANRSISFKFKKMYMAAVYEYSYNSDIVQCCPNANIILRSVQQFEPVLRKQASHRYEYDTYDNGREPHVPLGGSQVLRANYLKAVDFYKQKQAEKMA
jgi:hypothetical protein